MKLQRKKRNKRNDFWGLKKFRQSKTGKWQRETLDVPTEYREPFSSGHEKGNVPTEKAERNPNFNGKTGTVFVLQRNFRNKRNDLP